MVEIIDTLYFCEIAVYLLRICYFYFTAPVSDKDDAQPVFVWVGKSH